MIMRTAYRVIAYLLALSVAVQASLIAFGAFALENNIDSGPVSDGDTTGVTLHHSFAYVVVLSRSWPWPNPSVTGRILVSP